MEPSELEAVLASVKGYKGHPADWLVSDAAQALIDEIDRLQGELKRIGWQRYGAWQLTTQRDYWRAKCYGLEEELASIKKPKSKPKKPTAEV